MAGLQATHYPPVQFEKRKAISSALQGRRRTDHKTL